jgi:hypothetical protein
MQRVFEAYLEKNPWRQGMVNNFKSIINEIIPGINRCNQNFNILTEDIGAKAIKILVKIKVNEKLWKRDL